MSFFEKIFFRPETEKPKEQKKEPEISKPEGALKSEHLKEGVRPIIACIGTHEQLADDPFLKGKSFYGFDTSPQNKLVDNVDYYGNPEELKRQNFKNAGEESYTISPVDTLDKLSRSFMNCTGLVVTGRDKKTGQNISFLSHEDPEYFLKEKNRSKFVKDLESQLEEIRKRSEVGTIDAVIVGGNWFEDSRSYRTAYLESIKLLSEQVNETLGFEPVVMTGPKTTYGEDNVFYDNEHRRLYILRGEIGKAATKSFLQSDVKKQEEQWENKV